MPGRNPAAAVRAFLDPIQQAASVLGQCKVTPSPGGLSPSLNDGHSWSLNSGAGHQVVLGDHTPAIFDATMYWRVIEDERLDYGPVRVTTTGYNYRLRLSNGAELWALHWHPTGVSPVDTPHLHLGSAALHADGPLTPAAHLGVSRMTFEQSIRWVIESGASPTREDWADRLVLSEAPHLLYRNWSGDRPPGVGRHRAPPDQSDV